jgi:hypothetical protein
LLFWLQYFYFKLTSSEFEVEILYLTYSQNWEKQWK